MATDFATIQVNGRMTADPKEFPVGESAKVVFSVAVNRNFKNKDGEWTKKPTFIDCVAWGFSGQHVMKYGKKGVKVALTGNLEDDRYAKEGVEVKRTNVNVENITIFSASEEGLNDKQPEPEPAKAGRGRPKKGTEEVPY